MLVTEKVLVAIEPWPGTKWACNTRAKKQWHTGLRSLLDPLHHSCTRAHTHAHTHMRAHRYYLRFIDPSNTERMIDPVKEKYWMPVDLYVGGAEHAVLHLLYARFWHKEIEGLWQKVELNRIQFTQLLKDD
eukprot:1156476-Pelagomonas_calceolata.AAC.10